MIKFKQLGILPYVGLFVIIILIVLIKSGLLAKIARVIFNWHTLVILAIILIIIAIVRTSRNKKSMSIVEMLNWEMRFKPLFIFLWVCLIMVSVGYVGVKGWQALKETLHSSPTPAMVEADREARMPVLTVVKRYHFEKDSTYRYYVSGPPIFFIQEGNDTVRFYHHKMGHSLVSWGETVVRDHYHLIEPQKFDNHYDGSTGWFLIKADRTEEVNVTADPILY